MRLPTPARARDRIAPALGDELGFTLVELLVVILTIGSLALIALPQFLGQQKSGRDADAKSNARILVTEIQTCYQEREHYKHCDSEAELGGGLGLSWGTGPGQVQVREVGSKTFRVVAVSRAVSDGANHRFLLIHNSDGSWDRTCTTGGGDDRGGCADGRW